MKLIFTKCGPLKKTTNLLLFLSLLSVMQVQAHSIKKTPINNAPPQTITGLVKDNTGQGIPGVSIKVSGTNLGTVTNNEGKYKIVVNEANSVLVFSYIGFRTQEVSVAGKSVINITLTSSDSNLDEIVVVGYGSQSRETLTTSISKLDTRTLENVPYANALSAMQGSIAGVRVQSVTGQPGQPPRVVLRGGASINQSTSVTANSPLYLVDGVIRSNLADVAAEDIESLQVLKDAAATSIYGSRATNGVVLVTTKSGKAGVTKISYSYDLTRADEGSRALEYVSAADYVYYERVGNMMALPKIGASALAARLATPSGTGTGNDLTNKTAFTTQYLTPANQFKLNEGWQSIQDPYDPAKTIIFNETDFQSLRMKTAVSQNHFINASGGTEKAKFNVGLGYLKAEGTALSSDYSRLSANVNGTLQVTKKVSLTSRVLFASTNFQLIAPETGANGGFTSTGGNLANVFYRSASMPSTTKANFEDGSIAPGVNGGLGNPLYYQTGPFSPQRKNTGNKMTVSLSGKWDILPGLSFDPLLSYFKDEQFGRAFQPGYLTGVSTFSTTRASSQYQNNTTNLQADGVLTYAKKLGRHNFEAKAGYTYFNRNAWSIFAGGDGAATDLVTTVNGAATPRTTTGGENVFVTQGTFARLTYDFEQKYLASFSARYDGASNVGSANRFGFFPGVGLGWNVHKEEFWKSVPKLITALKIRATYGENGNIGALSDYGWQGTFTVGNQYNGAAAIITGELPNPDLRWEHSKTFDVGLDIGLLQNRVSLILDYFNKNTDDVILNVVLPTSSGYSVLSTNNGSLVNKGFEAELNVQVMKPQNPFQWSINFNASKVSSRVTQLPNNGVLGNRQGGLEVWDEGAGAYVWKAGSTAGSTAIAPSSFIEGGRIGDMYAYRFLGVYATDAEAAQAPYDVLATLDFGSSTLRTKFGGDAIYDDIDKNGVIDSRDQVYVGNAYPTWTGGFSNYFNYKGFSLSVRTDFSLGATIYNYPRVFADSQFQGDLMPTKSFIENSWKKQGDITNTPRYVHQVNGNVHRSSQYYESADYLALREITLGYTLSSKLLSKLKISTVRLNLTGANLYYFTKYQGQNPEEGGVDNGHYPNPRSIILGANISF